MQANVILRGDIRCTQEEYLGFIALMKEDEAAHQIDFPSGTSRVNDAKWIEELSR